MTDRRRLALLRHATAEQSGVRDHERALSERGPDEARAAARWLAEQGFVPDHVLVSDALRTRQTAAAALLEWSSEPQFAPLVDETPAVYVAGTDSLLDLIRQVPVDTGSLLVIGHNPTVAQLVQLLDEGSGAGDAAGVLATGFPPASVALFEVEPAWLRLQFFGAALLGARSGGECR